VTVYTRSLYLLTAKELTSPGYLGDLIAIECTARLSWHLRGLDNLRERARVLRKRKASAASVRRAYERKRLPSLDDEDALQEAGALAQDLHSAVEGLALSTVVLTLQAESQAALDTATRRALSLIGTRLGIVPGKGRGYQGPLWRASLPLGQNTARRRAKRWHTSAVGNGFSGHGQDLLAAALCAVVALSGPSRDAHRARRPLRAVRGPLRRRLYRAGEAGRPAHH